MTVREIMECITSPVWITLDEDSRTGDKELLVENPTNAEDTLSEQVLDHEVYLMHAEEDRLVISLYTAQDVQKERFEPSEEALERAREMLNPEIIVGGRMPNEWISVDERLPDNLEAVLCYHAAYYYSIDRIENGRWRGENVRYWMPLPEPPEREVNV